MSTNFSDPGVFEQLPHDSRGGFIIGVGCGSITVTTILVLLRLYTRFYIRRAHGIDDYMTVVALVTQTLR